MSFMLQMQKELQMFFSSAKSCETLILFPVWVSRNTGDRRNAHLRPVGNLTWGYKNSACFQGKMGTNKMHNKQQKHLNLTTWNTHKKHHTGLTALDSIKFY